MLPKEDCEDKVGQINFQVLQVPVCAIEGQPC